MRGREFLVPAEELAGGRTEAHWRASAGRSYYALFQEAHATLVGWGVRIPPRENVHAFVRIRFVYSSDPDASRLGDDLEWLVKLRNEADYHLAQSRRFADAEQAEHALEIARRAIDTLDAIESDPAHRAEVIASIRS